MPKEIDEQLFTHIYEQIATMSECDLEEQKEILKNFKNL